MDRAGAARPCDDRVAGPVDADQGPAGVGADGDRGAPCPAGRPDAGLDDRCGKWSAFPCRDGPAVRGERHDGGRTLADGGRRGPGLPVGAGTDQYGRAVVGVGWDPAAASVPAALTASPGWDPDDAHPAGSWTGGDHELAACAGTASAVAVPTAIRHWQCEAKAADGSGHGRPPCGLGVCTDSSDRKPGAPGQARAGAGC